MADTPATPVQATAAQPPQAGDPPVPQAPARVEQPAMPPRPRAKVRLGIPVMDKPHLQFMNTLFRSLSTSQRCQVNANWLSQDSLITRARNCLFSDWLFRGDEEYFCSLDSDLELVNCNPGNNIFDMLYEDLQQPGVDFCGGLYSVKSMGGPPRSASVSADFGPPPPHNSGLHEMLWLSTGCWFMRRKVGEALLAAHPELVYDGDGGNAGKKMFGPYLCYIMRIEPGSLPGVTKPILKCASEDWAFCQRWRDCGGKIWNDSRIILKHWGSHPYSLYEPRPAEPKPA